MPAGRPREGKPRIVPIAIYLGGGEDKERRLEAIDNLAGEFGLNRSQLMQEIGDGKFKLERRKRRPNSTE
jgi:hypothetical protein